MIRISLFEGMDKTAVDTREYEALKGMEELFENRLQASSSKEKYGASFMRCISENGRRRREDVQGLTSSLIALDIDDTGTAPAEFAKVLEDIGWNHIVYTSFGHKHKGLEGDSDEENDKHDGTDIKFRILLQVNQEYSQINGDEISGAINSHICQRLKAEGLVFKLDSVSDTFTQLFYYDTVANSEESKTYSWHEGEMVDISEVDYSIKTSAVVEGEVGRKTNYYEKAASMVMGNTFHVEKRDFAYQLAKEGVPRAANIQLLDFLMDLSKSAGTPHWQKRRDENAHDVDTGIARAKSEAESAEVVKMDDIELVEEIMPELPWPEGLMGELADNIFNSMIIQHRNLAVMIAVGIGSVVVGRNYNSVNKPGYGHLGMNCYILAAGDTGMGKSAIEKYIKFVFSDVAKKANSIIGAASDTGPKALADSLGLAATQISVSPEAGILAKVTSGDQNGLRGLKLNLYTSSAYDGITDKRGGSGEDATIKSMRAPCYSQMAESTKDVIYEALRDADSLNQGMLPRYSPILLGKPIGLNDNARRDIRDMSKELQERIIELTGDPQSGVDKPKITEVACQEGEMQAERKGIFEKYQLRAEIKDSEGAMAKRMYEKFMKYACIYTVMNGDSTIESNLCSVNQKLIRISAAAWGWAKEMIRIEEQVIRQFLGEMEYSVNSGEEAIRDAKNLLRDIFSGKCKDSKILKSSPRVWLDKGIVNKSAFIQLLNKKASVRRLSSRDNSNSIKSGSEKVIEALTRSKSIEIRSEKHPGNNRQREIIRLLAGIND